MDLDELDQVFELILRGLAGNRNVVVPWNQSIVKEFIPFFANMEYLKFRKPVVNAIDRYYSVFFMNFLPMSRKEKGA